MDERTPESEAPRKPAGMFRRLPADDLDLATDIRTTLLVQNPRGGRIIVWLILLFVVVFLAWASLSEIDEVTRALAADGVAAYGPRYDLPTGSWFGYDVYSFPTNDAAAEFMMDSRDHANLCSSTPISYTEIEADMGFLNDQFSDDIVWNVQEASAASAGQFLDGEGIVRITVEMRYTTQAEGATLSVNETILVLYEQHGRTVVEYWVGGNWNFAGIGTGQPEHAHQPQQTELDAAADMVGSVLLPNLTTLGAV